MTVRVIAYARIRELLGTDSLERALPEGATVADCFDVVARDMPAIAALRSSTRFARRGTFVAPDQALADGDEIGFLPPYGGG